MIYASDLDRTLIYSQSFLDIHPANIEVVLVDKSKVDSYMAKCVAEQLEDLTSNTVVRFIPVTARSIAEYKRINFPFKQPEYAITTCGGKILHNGEPMQEWEAEIAKSIDSDELEEVVNQLDKLSSTNYKSKAIDGVYAFSKSSDLQQTKIEIAELNKTYPHFKFSLDKHKVYAIPKCVGKDIALTWIKHYLNEDKVAASGDSTFDVPMLIIADIAIVPSHRYIKDQELKNMEFIEVSGEIVSPLHTIEFIQSMR